MLKTSFILSLVFSLWIAPLSHGQDAATAGWKAIGAAVPSHHYPSRGRFTRSPEGDMSKRITALKAAAQTSKGTSAEGAALYFLGNAHFFQNQFADALTVFTDLQSRLPKHGLCVTPVDAESKLSYVAKAIADCQSEIEIRKVYTPRELPVAVIDNAARAVFHTIHGDFTMAFYKTAAPETFANFKKLVTGGWFNKSYFHRVQPMQTAEAGCPNTKEGNRNRNDDGDGSPGYDLPIELNTATHNAGAVSMKRLRGSKRSHGSQFIICATPQPRLNNDQAVFGQVVDGLDIVKRISQERADDQNRPYEHIWITGVEWIEEKARDTIDGN